MRSGTGDAPSRSGSGGSRQEEHMGCRIFREKNDGHAVLYCSTTDWAFGPVFRNYAQAVKFLDWLAVTPNEEKTLMCLSKGDPRRGDPRSYEDDALERLYSKFLAEVPE
jgi:hypothetical protein